MANWGSTTATIKAVLSTRTKSEPRDGNATTESIVIVPKKTLDDAEVTPKENDWIEVGGAEYLVTGIEVDPIQAAYILPVRKL